MKVQKRKVQKMKVQKMKVCELAERLGLKVTAGSNGLENEICGCYIGDLLSLAMARVEKGYVWITIQTNINIIAVASLGEAACIILPDGLLPDEHASNKADLEGIPVLSSEKSAYELAAALSECGI